MSPYSQVETSIIGWTIRVRGTVQGVGFRPTVFKLANQMGIKGRVLNDGDGVSIEAFAPKSTLAAFVQAIAENSPPLARIEEVTHKELEHSDRLGTPAIPTAFVIDTSETSASNTIATNIAADAATCAACIDDIFSPSNRRFRYPFTNCTHCGPRLSIIKGIPYDRPMTSMAVFPMCTDCQREYRDPEDRRFHAQPNACSLCGPKVWLEDKNGIKVDFAAISTIDAIDAATNLIKQGEIVAIKGIGGFHLACDASNEQAVATLRERKQRFDKPFALMARDLDLVKKYCQVSRAEESRLASNEAPIVLLDRNELAILEETEVQQIAASVAPGQATLGFMLPYTPLHQLLLKSLDMPIVLTSGNRSEEPQCTDNDEAKERLCQIADYFLLHDRAIVNRLDDSVVRVVDDISACGDISSHTKVAVLRRARGYAPSPIKLPPGFASAQEILALGAELKNTFCLLQNNCAIVSQHMGDLEEANTYRDYQKNLELYKNCFQFKPKLIAIDFHPEYLSSKLGGKLALEIESKSETEAEIEKSIVIDKVQHHHAHIASCLADNGWPREAGPVLGVALDGLGYGLDGSYWGGEFLLADYGSFERLANFKPVAMLGGAQAMREPWRNTYAHIVAALGWPGYLEQFAELELTKYFQSKALVTFNSMLQSKINAPLASSSGRLFDAVAAAIGICRSAVTYEGQAAIELEALVNDNIIASEINHGYSFTIADSENGLPYIEPQIMWQSLLDDLRLGTAAAVMATRFHIGLANIIVAMVEQLCRHKQLCRHDQKSLPEQEKWMATVALSGGVFQNRTLLELVRQNLTKGGYTVLTHQQVPTNDGGISLGQAVVAAARQIEKEERSHVSWHTWASR